MNIKKYFLLFCWCSLIFYLSNLPNLKITDKNIIDFILRKFAHITEYFVLYILAFNAMRNKKYAFVFSVFYAATDEYHQTFIQGRSGSLRDVLIDSIGIFCGCFFQKQIEIIKLNLMKILKKMKILKF